MTEAEWVTCENPVTVLDYLHHKTSDRKLRLFACACCRRIWQVLDDASQRAVEVAERYASDTAESDELIEAGAAADAAGRFALAGQSAASVAFAGAKAAAAAAAAAEPAGRVDAAEAAGHAAFAAYLLKLKPWQTSVGYGELLRRADADGQEARAQCRLLRELVGNPFQPIVAEPAWLIWNDRTVPRIAQAILRKRDFDHMPILADALEDAGCDNADILAHCRGPNEHVRGCWVVDLLLGKNQLTTTSRTCRWMKSDRSRV